MASNKEKSDTRRVAQKAKDDAALAMEKHIRRKLSDEEVAFIGANWRRFLPRGGQ